MMEQATTKPAVKPVVLDVQYPERVSRVLNFLIVIKLILAIPHLIILSVYGIAFAITNLIAWVVILFTGKYPRGLFDFGLRLMRWQTRVNAYLFMLRDEYPPFNGEP